MSDAGFEALYRKHAPGAFARALRVLGNEADAHEVVHDVFLSLLERPEQYGGQSSMTTFLYSAVTHACLNRIRNGKNRLRLLEQHAAGDFASDTLDESAPAGERNAILRGELARLPEPLALCAVYYYLDELTHDDIARLLGCSRRHVGNLLSRLAATAAALAEVPA